MANNFTFTREQAEQMVQKVAGQSEAMKSAFDSLSASAENIKANWEGEGATAFANVYSELYNNYNALAAIFSEGCSAAKQAASMYESGDTEAASTVKSMSDTSRGITPAGFGL